jgi:hypothetical protein
MPRSLSYIVSLLGHVSKSSRQIVHDIVCVVELPVTFLIFQEEEQIKRLERLKLDRQKRMAARGNGKGPGNDAPKANGVNGLSKSVPTFTGMRSVKNGTTESLSDRLKRLSEPKSIVGAEHTLNPKSAGAGRSRGSMA